MIRNLFIIAVAALILAVLAFAGAAAIGGHEFRREGWAIRSDAWSLASSGDFHVGRDSRRDENTVERRIEWSGGEALSFSLPARVRYTQGPETSVIVSGAPQYVERVRFEDGRFTLEREGGGAMRGGDLRIHITAPGVTEFAVEGSHDLKIEDYDQDALTVRLGGSGGVEAEGRTRRLAVSLDGSGRVDAEDLEAEDADLRLSGSGSIRATARGRVDARVDGSGGIRLSNRPAQLNSQVSGSGGVRQDD